MKVKYEVVRDKSDKIFFSKTDNVCTNHFHRQLELLYNLKGNKRVFINNIEHLLLPNQLLIVNSFDIHKFEQAAKGSNQIVVALPKKYLSKYDEFMTNKMLINQIITDTKFCKTLLPILNSITEKEDTNHFSTEASVDYLLAQMIEKAGYVERIVSGSCDLVEKILNYIEEHYKEDINLSILAEHFGYSKFYFSRMFNSLLGTNINDYLSLIRLENALHTIKTDKCSVATAAFDNGFNSLQTFYRVYKNNHGGKNSESIADSN